MANALPSADELAAGILARDRAVLSRTITLTESTLASHQQVAQSALKTLLPRTGKAIRVGISGVPGAGKSTLIENLGNRLLDAGHRVAVLAIDPSSTRTGGSILGDKTRMATLVAREQSYVRPSPSGNSLGGVNRVTRESILLCEAAGYDVVLVETVGVGQSETVVAGMVDCYTVLMLPSAGDELQGIKKGILEHADIIAVNKDDGELQHAAQHARQTYQRALSILQPQDSWKPRAITLSATSGKGLDDYWQLVRQHRREGIESGAFEARRESQRVGWFRAQIAWQLELLMSQDADVEAERKRLEEAVRNGMEPPHAASEALMRFLRERLRQQTS